LVESFVGHHLRLSWFWLRRGLGSLHRSFVSRKFISRLERAVGAMAATKFSGLGRFSLRWLLRRNRLLRWLWLFLYWRLRRLFIYYGLATLSERSYAVLGELRFFFRR
jgi:hypothetical protein